MVFEGRDGPLQGGCILDEDWTLELQFSLQLHLVELHLALQVGFTLKMVSGF
jgi:hypothetical protein